MKRLRTRLRVLRRRGGKGLVRSALWFLTKIAVGFALFCALWVVAYRFVPPPITYLMATEWIRTGDLTRDWTNLEDMSPHIARAVMAAEDARFCSHYGFDFDEIRKALAEDDRRRGASTLSQQVAKNAFLWPEASWTRKGLEAGFTVLIELFWPKHRIMEVYLNIAEVDEGHFGAEAGAQRYFGKKATDLTLTEAARLAAVLPNPRGRDARRISGGRTAAIKDGAETLRRDGRADCVMIGKG